MLQRKPLEEKLCLPPDLYKYMGRMFLCSFHTSRIFYCHRQIRQNVWSPLCHIYCTVSFSFALYSSETCDRQNGLCPNYILTVFEGRSSLASEIVSFSWDLKLTKKHVILNSSPLWIELSAGPHCKKTTMVVSWHPSTDSWDLNHEATWSNPALEMGHFLWTNREELPLTV